MDLILDTHALVWLLLGDKRLGGSQLALVNDPANRVFISAVTGYEIANKFRTGKMPEAWPILELLERDFAAFDWQHLPVRLDHARRAGGIEGPHRDPFDRLLAAQSIVEKMPIITKDPAFKVFGVETVW